MGIHMESNLSFLKRSRQELRTLAKEIMSGSDYATYVSEESTWENQVDENILSIKNILFGTNQSAHLDLVVKIELPGIYKLILYMYNNTMIQS